MKHLITLVAAFILQACGPSLHLGDFAQYAYDFRSEAAKRGVEVILADVYIEYHVLDAKTLADCRGGSDKIIRVDPVKWETLTEAQREVLMYHEFGHCLLDKDHTPYTIMQSTLLNADYYVGNKESLLDQLFR
jgi:hypothetical protein